MVKLRTLQICHCVQLNALFCCLWRNIEVSCHKHFVVFSGNQHRRLLPAITCETVAVHRRPHLQHLPVAVLTQAVKPDRLRIAISAYPTCIRRPRWGGDSRRNVVMPFGTEKLEWRGYPKVKKF